MNQPGVRKAMTSNIKTTLSDLTNDIAAFERQLEAKVRGAGLKNKFISGAMIERLRADGANLAFSFKAGRGMDHMLTTIVTPNIVDTAARRDQLADNFIAHMKRAVDRAPTAAESRTAIARAAEEVFAEARAEGIELELLRLEPSPILVFGDPRAKDNFAQVFYVHIVMPHFDGTSLTRDSYTVDADDAEEFADYLRSYTLPELRELNRTHAQIEVAA
jgi:hypothetical protein